MEKDYLIAGLRVRMDTFGRTEEQAEFYATDTVGEPDMIIAHGAEYFQQLYPHLDLDACEYLATGSYFYNRLLKYDAMLLHSSAVVMDGYAYLFSAPCGTGKSTHTSMWRQAFGEERTLMLNDDKPVLRLEDGRWYAYGTPWSGKTSLNLNMRVPVGGVCMLARGQTNEIVPFGGMQALREILEQTARPQLPERRNQLLGLLDKLLNMVPVWKLKCTPTPEAALVSQKAMSEEAKKRFG